MKLKIALATASAIGLMMGAAWAGSANTLYLVQNGAGNEGSIDQSWGAGGNDIGAANAPVRQDGDGNYLGYTNSGYAHGADNDIVKLRQLGDYNWFKAIDNNGATGNRINDVRQTGDTNQAVVTRRGDDNSVVDRVLMEGDGNVIYIYQGTPAANGHGNKVHSVSIKGNNNGQPNTTQQYRGASTNNGAIHIVQAGTENEILKASIEGNNNGKWPNPHAMTIRQTGNNNGADASTAIMLGAGDNYINVNQTGDRNNFDVRQGLNTASTGNDATVMQTGDDNWARATQYGSYNQLAVIQNGDHNSSTTLFDGDGNGSGSFTGGPAAGLTNANLVQGQVFQDSGSALTGNSLTYTVYGSNNLFAFAQLGSDNTVSGKVGTGAVDSNGNQVAVLQTGDGNNSTFTQNGGGNNLAVSQ